jgi:hypothetical protein
MFGRRGFGILWLLLTAVIASVVGVAAYQAGVGAALSHPGVAPPYDYGYGWAWGFGYGAFHLLGFLFFLLLLLFLFRLAFRPWLGGGRLRGRWYGGGGGGRYPRHVQSTFEDLHRRAHGDAPAPSEQPPQT